jgi:hypothetical protein
MFYVLKIKAFKCIKKNQGVIVLLADPGEIVCDAEDPPDPA